MEIRVDENIVRRLEELVRISLTLEERRRMVEELNKILEWMRILIEANVDAEPLYHPGGVEGLLRKDEPKPSPPRDELLKNAVEVENGFVKAPKLVES